MVMTKKARAELDDLRERVEAVEGVLQRAILAVAERRWPGIGYMATQEAIADFLAARWNRPEFAEYVRVRIADLRARAEKDGGRLDTFNGYDLLADALAATYPVDEEADR